MPLPALGSMGFAPKAALWIIATAGGALLGAAATAYWNRGQPDVRVEDVSITDLYNGRFQAASQIQVPSDDIMTKLRSHKWTNGIRQSSLPISDFIQNLRDDERRLTDLIQSLERYRASRDQIRLTLDQPMSKATAERLFEAWEPNDDFLWGAIRGEYRRGTYVLPRKFTDAEDAEWYGNEPLLRLRELITEEGAPVYTVTIPGGLYASALLPEDGDDFVLNKVAAYALAYFDKETLSTFIEVIDDELRNIDTHRNVRDEVRKMIDRFSRWSFAITAVNNGIQPLAFSGSATVLIDTRNVNQFGSENSRYRSGES